MKVPEEKKLNIGLFIDTWFPMIDGVITVVDNYAKRLSKIANVTVFTVSARDRKYVDNFPYRVVRCKKMQLPFLDYDLPLPNLDKKFMKEVDNSNLDIVHIHSPFSIGKVGVNYAKKHKIPVVATNHSQFKQDFFKATKSPAITDVLLDHIMRIFNRCDENWSVNSEVAKVYDEYGLKKPAKVVNNATDMEYIQDDSCLKELREKYEIKDDEKVLLFVGRICKLKNIFFILDSLIELKNMGFKFKMLFVGTGQDEDEFKEKIAKKNMDDCVKLVGKIADRTELAKHYRLADLFLFPSLYDCSSLVQIEAASQKTPTLFLENSVTSDGIEESLNGYFAENNPKKYAKKIVEIFENQELYDDVAENCHKTVYVNWDKKVEFVFEEYKRLIRQKKSRNKAVENKSKYPKTIDAVKKSQKKNKKKQQISNVSPK